MPFQTVFSRGHGSWSKILVYDDFTGHISFSMYYTAPFILLPIIKFYIVQRMSEDFTNLAARFCLVDYTQGGG